MRWDLAESWAELCPGPVEGEPQDLPHLARLAWRNSNRCIGRALWRTLETLDARSAEEPAEIFEALRNHLNRATNDGRVRSVLTCFREWRGPEEELRVWNHQLVRYAGYDDGDGRVLGDPMNVKLTSIAMALGWRPPSSPGPFDLLPVVIQSGERLEWFEWPQGDVLEIPLRHPRYAAFEELGLRWYAVPAISDMIFATGSEVYPCAPFNGHYMGTEIGARDLADESRYNYLQVIADRLGFDRKSSRTLWKDRSLVLLNEAVLWSFDREGVRIADHHRASEAFLRFCSAEKRDGREVNADWSWIVPPMSGSTTGVFHQAFRNEFEFPNFIPQVEPWKTKRGRRILDKNAREPAHLRAIDR